MIFSDMSLQRISKLISWDKDSFPVKQIDQTKIIWCLHDVFRYMIWFFRELVNQSYGTNSEFF